MNHPCNHCMLADRLEAAYKRELSKICPKTGGDFGQLGDAAKLREALEVIRAAHAKCETPHDILVCRIIDDALGAEGGVK